MTEHYKSSEEDHFRSLPGVFFFYDLSPIKVSSIASVQKFILMKFCMCEYQPLWYKFLESFTNIRFFRVSLKGELNFTIVVLCECLLVTGDRHGGALIILTLHDTYLRYSRR